MAPRRYLAATERRAARTPARTARQRSQAQRSDSGLPVGQDHGSRRKRARVRPRQEGRREQAPPTRGYRGLGARSSGAQRQGARPRRHKAPARDPARERLVRLAHLWVDAGYQGRARRWAEEVMGVSVEIVRKPPKPVPEEVAKRWAAEWAKEGKEVDWQRLMPPKGFRVLPRRWVVERTFAWICHNRRMAKDYERLCATGEAFVYVAMTRLMVRRLARA